MAQGNVLIHPSPVQSVKFTTDETVEKNQPYAALGLHGVVMQDAASGELVVLDVSPRTWQVKLTGLTVAAGDQVYVIEATGALTTTKGSNRWFGTVVSEQDADDNADVLVAPQTDTSS